MPAIPPIHKPKKLPWEEIEKLCKIDCTGEEIAAFIDCDYDTLQTACKRINKIPISEYIKIKRGAGNVSLRRRQFKTAMEGNTTMLIWLGKQRLGQTDKQVIESTNSHNISFVLSAEDIDL
jgi:hypothetical protein